MTFGFLLLAAVKLVGFTGDDLTVRADFDVNNANVRDPLVLTIDFIGDADFTTLHPPALAKHVDKSDWKVDDMSAKTETDTKRIGGFFSSREVAVSRSLTYRVTPQRAGVLWFPSLSFEYKDANGNVRTAPANEIPVHVKENKGRANADQGAALNIAIPDMAKMPEPPEILSDPGVPLSDDDMFAWRKACAMARAVPAVERQSEDSAEASADESAKKSAKEAAKAFEKFAFPSGRMNEATCAIRAGEWRHALSIYNRLEWFVGQTPEIERGIIAARAVKFDNAEAELPVWRVVCRPVLRYAWAGRVGILLAALAGVSLLFWLLGRVIKALACIAFAVMLVPAAHGQGVFEEMERVMQEHRRMMQSMQHQMGQMQTMSFSMGGEENKPVEVKVTVRTEPAELQVGESFAFILAIETPKSASVGQIQIQPSEMYGLTQDGRVENLTDGKASNPSNVVKRLSIPVRYDVPFKGPISFRVSGMVSGRQRTGNMSFTFSNNFTAETPPIDVDIRPLPSAGQPEDFSGIISEGLRLSERLDMSRVESNDVIRITYRLEHKGYLPKKWKPKDVAFEIGRGKTTGGMNAVEWLRYFIADGAAKTPRLSISYYDPKTKEYRRVEAGGSNVEYRK